MKKMYDLFRLPTYQHLCAIGGFFACLLFGFQVNAQTVTAPDAAFQRFMWTTTGANSQGISVGTGGTLVASPAGSGTLAADGSKSLAYTRAANWRNGSNNPVTGSIASRIPIDSKTAKILSKGMKAVPFLGTGVALWEMATELGFDPKKETDGSVSVVKRDPAVCYTSGGCTFFTTRTWDNSNFQAFTARSTQSASCDATVAHFTARMQSTGFGHQLPLVVTSYANCSFRNSAPTPTHYNTYGYGTLAVPATTSPGIPSSLQELEDAIAAKSGWPSTSKLPRAVTDATSATGEQVTPETPRLTGPATSTGTTSTTVNPTNNTTTTNTVTHNHTYNDNRVTNTITTASTVTNNTTGAATTTTTTEQPVEEPSECEKNPGSIGCAELDTPTVEIPKTEKRVSYQAENLGFGGGSCPANVVMTPAHMASPITVINWADNCQKITTYAKPMILAMALFAAMMIIFVGKTE